jgi:hypothetical protein
MDYPIFTLKLPYIYQAITRRLLGMLPCIYPVFTPHLPVHFTSALLLWAGTFDDAGFCCNFDDDDYKAAYGGLG